MCYIRNQTWFVRVKRTQRLICTVHIKPFYGFLFGLHSQPVRFIRLSLIIHVYSVLSLFSTLKPPKHISHSYTHTHTHIFISVNFVCASFYVVVFLLSTETESLLSGRCCQGVFMYRVAWNATKHIVPLLDLDFIVWYVCMFISAFFLLHSPSPRLSHSNAFCWILLWRFYCSRWQFSINNVENVRIHTAPNDTYFFETYFTGRRIKWTVHVSSRREKVASSKYLYYLWRQCHFIPWRQRSGKKSSAHQIRYMKKDSSCDMSYRTGDVRKY